jgi:ABC-type nickel/cobalt efflux system permease component RcnA
MCGSANHPQYCGRAAFGKLWMTSIALAMVLVSSPCFAHPMGNFSISHYAGIKIDKGSVDIRYLVDMAEIPTFQEMQQSGISAQANDPKLAPYLNTKAIEFAAGLHVTVDGQPLVLTPVSQNAIFPAGAGGLPTMKFGFLYRITIDACKELKCELNYSDSNFPGHAGWKEIVVERGPNVTIENSTAPSHDRSNQLTDYPTDLINSPPQALEARVGFSFAPTPVAEPTSLPTPIAKLAPTLVRPETAKETVQAGSPTATSPISALSPAPEKVEVKPNRQQTPRSAFTQLIATQDIGIGVALLAALISAGLGALHALEPGHGKTIVAAYLVGTKGTPQQAFLLGMIVTATHTAGVYLLGAVTLYAQKYILPEKLYPFLGVLSGMLIAGMGCYLFLQRLADVELGFVHAHGAGGHSHMIPFASPASATRPVDGPPLLASKNSIPLRQLLVLGITGGIVPCPAALVVLLSALALHRVLFGLFLIVAFSIGLAVVLIALGMFAVYSSRWISRLRTEDPLIQRWLPLTSAATITIIGCAIAARGLMTAGIV